MDTQAKGNNQYLSTRVTESKNQVQREKTLVRDSSSGR